MKNNKNETNNSNNNNNNISNEFTEKFKNFETRSLKRFEFLEDKTKMFDDEILQLKKEHLSSKGTNENSNKHSDRIMSEMDKLENRVNEISRNSKNQEDIKKQLNEIMEKLKYMEFENEKKYEE